jgi:hypothetical protein
MHNGRSDMYKNLIKATVRMNSLSSENKKIAGSHIKTIMTLKNEMEAFADQKGYAKACRRSIPHCRGECCKWHFPKNLNHIDFFIAIFHMTPAQQQSLVHLILSNSNEYCPILLKTGCFLSFEQRPVTCTNAYPCFNNREYWIEKEKKNLLFFKEMNKLQELF